LLAAGSAPVQKQKSQASAPTATATAAPAQPTALKPKPKPPPKSAAAPTPTNTAATPGRPNLLAAIKPGEATAPFNSARLILTGGGGEGKSSTLGALLNRPFDSAHASTIGAETTQAKINRVQAQGWAETAEADLVRVVKAGLQRDPQSAATKQASVKSVFDKVTGKGDSAQSKQSKSTSTALFPNLFSAGTGTGAISRATSAATPVPDQQPTASQDGIPRLTEIMSGLEVRLGPNASKTDLDAAAALSIALWDLGGQTVFYDLLQMLMSPYSVYLLCFDMQKLAHSTRPDKRASCLTYIKHWLGTMALHAAGAKVLLVGTHGDKVSQRHDHEEMSRLLVDELTGSGLPTTDIVKNYDRVWFFPVDNTRSGADAGVQRLRTAIEETAVALPQARFEMPVRWLACLDGLRSADARAREAGQQPIKHMSLDRFCEVARGCSISREEAVEEMLPVLHELGMLLHFRQPAALNELVVLHPQWLIDQFTCFIRDFSQHIGGPMEAAVGRGSFLRLKMLGQLLPDLLPVGWPHLSRAEQTACLELMCLYRLAVPLSAVAVGGAVTASAAASAHDAADRAYLLPSMLPVDLSGASVAGSLTDELSEQVLTRMSHYSPATTTDNITTTCYFALHLTPLLQTEVIDLALVARMGYLPSGLYARLLCQLVREHQYGNEHEQLALSKSVSQLQFGCVSVEIAVVREVSGLRVTVHAREGGGRLVARVEEALQAVLRDSFPTLSYTAVLPYSATVVLGRDWVVDKFKAMEAVKVKHQAIDARQLYAGFVPQVGLLPRYDVMISYRWAANKKFVLRLRDQLSQVFLSNGRQLATFLDEEGIQLGSSIDDVFCTALSTCSVALPVVSVQALENMRDLAVSDAVDNLLMEWSLMLVLRKQKKLGGICPLLVGDGWSYTSDMAVACRSFTTFKREVETLPQTVSHATYDRIDGFLGDALGLPPASPRRTVREVVKELLQFNSIDCFNAVPDNFAALATYKEQVRCAVEGVQVSTIF
jgi:GTPase SAR1 family protein